MQRKSLLEKIFLSFFRSIALSCCIVAFVWIVTGMKYGIYACIKSLWLAFILIYSGQLLYVLGCEIYDSIKVDKALTHTATHGYDDEFFKLLYDYLDGCEDNPSKMMYASYLNIGKKYDRCAEVMKQVDFSSLGAEDREEYFNILLYRALCMDDIQLANNIYRQAKHYFDRAVMKGRGADIEHTLGVLCLKNGRIKNAVDLFLSAMDKDKSVACDCEIDLGWCALRSGDKALAKKQCYQAAEKTVSRHHAERLKELMLAVEKAYKLQK